MIACLQVTCAAGMIDISLITADAYLGHHALKSVLSVCIDVSKAKAADFRAISFIEQSSFVAISATSPFISNTHSLSQVCGHPIKSIRNSACFRCQSLRICLYLKRISLLMDTIRPITYVPETSRDNNPIRLHPVLYP